MANPALSNKGLKCHLSHLLLLSPKTFVLLCVCHSMWEKESEDKSKVEFYNFCVASWKHSVFPQENVCRGHYKVAQRSKHLNSSHMQVSTTHNPKVWQKKKMNSIIWQGAGAEVATDSLENSLSQSLKRDMKVGHAWRWGLRNLFFSLLSYCDLLGWSKKKKIRRRKKSVPIGWLNAYRPTASLPCLPSGHLHLVS